MFNMLIDGASGGSLVSLLLSLPPILPSKYCKVVEREVWLLVG